VFVFGGETMGRVLTREELAAALASQRREGARMVFTNGCFDLLHPGHIRSFEFARSLGGEKAVLVVGVNSDASVRRNKGPARPIIPEAERAEILAALGAVDYVTIFDEDTPRELIAALLPDVLVKGGDWGPNEIVGREEVEAAGGRVVSAPTIEGFSTTAMIEKAARAGRKSSQAAGVRGANPKK
jgi:D-glycero-beta-D-manno-heptose 1-phosphate adenylyltransferase